MKRWKRCSPLCISAGNYAAFITIHACTQSHRSASESGTHIHSEFFTTVAWLEDSATFQLVGVRAGCGEQSSLVTMHARELQKPSEQEVFIATSTKRSWCTTWAAESPCLHVRYMPYAVLGSQTIDLNYSIHSSFQSIHCQQFHRSTGPFFYSRVLMPSGRRHPMLCPCIVLPDDVHASPYHQCPG